MKKLISAILINLIIVLCLTSTVSAASSPQIAASNAEGTPGETVEITVVLKDNPGIVSMTLTATFDERILTLVEVNDTALMPGQMHTTKKTSPYTLTWENDTSRTDYYVNGTVVSLSFKISDTAESGDYSIILSYPVDGIYNYDVENIDFNLIHGKVCVKENSSSDDSANPTQHIHNMIHVAGQEATCTRTGQLEYWYCSLCQKKYIDSAGTIAVSNTDLPVDATNHTGRIIIKNERTPTNDTDGYSGDIYCQECGGKKTVGYIIPAYGYDNTDYPDNTDDPNEFIDPWENPFVDIQKTDSYYNAIQFVYENGLFKGVSATEFAPETTMTRAMFVTVLGRLAGVNTMYFYGSSYDDVILGEWYVPYVEWASEYGIVNGYGDGRFGVNDKITIEQAAVIMARYAEYIGLSTSSDMTLIHYQDSNKVSSWAVEQMKWAVENRIYSGDNYNLNPQLPAKRSLVAEIIYSFVSKFN